MSKAFTRESDDAPEPSITPRVASTLPPGAKNYLTPDGAARMRAEADQLRQTARPRLLALTDDSDARRQLQGIDQRLRQIEHSLQTAVIVPPPTEPDERERVRFGANVTVREPSGELTVYRIVGADEIDLDRGWVSWLSPVAKALLNARRGQRVPFQSPAGRTELEVVGIDYVS